MSVELARAVASLVAAAGVGAVLDPLRVSGRGTTLVRGGGLVLAAAGALALLATLVPADAVRDALGSPARVALGLSLVALGLILADLAARAVVRRPVIWFLALALVLPVRLPVAFGGESASLLVPLYLTIGVGLLAWVRARAAGRLGADDDPRTPLDAPLAAFVGLLLVSSLWSADTGEAAVKAAFFYVPFVLLYLLVVAWWPHARATLPGRPAAVGGGLMPLALTTIALAVPVALFALWQYATQTLFWNATLQQANVYSRFFRVNGIFFDPNILGRFLALAILAALALAVVARRPRDLALLGAAGAVASAGLVVTFSRSSALMLMVGVAALAAWAFGARRTAVVGGGVLVLVAVAAIVVNQPVREAVTSVERLERVSEGRFDLARGGLSIWRDEPVLGAGLGGFAERFSERLTPLEQQRTRVIISHNAPVTVLSEVGLVGFALFLALLAAALAAMARGVRGAEQHLGLARWTLLAGVAGILVHSLFYSALFEDPYTWVLAAASFALAAAGGRTAPAAEAVAGRPAAAAVP